MHYDYTLSLQEMSDDDLCHSELALTLRWPWGDLTPPQGATKCQPLPPQPCLSLTSTLPQPHLAATLVTTNYAMHLVAVACCHPALTRIFKVMDRSLTGQFDFTRACTRGHAVPVVHLPWLVCDCKPAATALPFQLCYSHAQMDISNMLYSTAL